MKMNMKKRGLVLLAGLLGMIGLVGLRIRLEAIAHGQSHLVTKSDFGAGPSAFGGGGKENVKKS